MKLRFKHQKFQENATNALCDVFSGQPNQVRKFLQAKVNLFEHFMVLSQDAKVKVIR